MNMNKNGDVAENVLFLLLFHQKYLQKPKLVGLSVGNSP
jgi:hypothetical protein